MGDFATKYENIISLFPNTVKIAGGEAIFVHGILLSSGVDALGHDFILYENDGTTVIEQIRVPFNGTIELFKPFLAKNGLVIAGGVFGTQATVFYDPIGPLNSTAV